MQTRVTTHLFALGLLALTSGCNCGHNVLITSVGTNDARPVDSGILHFCGDGVVNPPEQCDVGFESGASARCNADCTLPAGVDAGPGTVEGPAEIAGTLSESAGILGPTALHPYLPIEGATVYLELLNGTSSLASTVTGADGRFHFSVSAGVAYQLRFGLASRFQLESEHRRRLSPVAAGATANADEQFYTRGLHFAVQNLTSGAPLDRASVSIVDARQVVLAGPRLTDAEGYVYFESTSSAGVMVFSKSGFVSNSLGEASVNTTHTVIGGIGLQPQ